MAFYTWSTHTPSAVRMQSVTFFCVNWTKILAKVVLFTLLRYLSICSQHIQMFSQLLNWVIWTNNFTLNNIAQNAKTSLVALTDLLTLSRLTYSLDELKFLSCQFSVTSWEHLLKMLFRHCDSFLHSTAGVLKVYIQSSQSALLSTSKGLK